MRRELLEALFAVRRESRAKPLLLEELAQGLADMDLVLDDQHVPLDGQDSASRSSGMRNFPPR